MLVGEPCVPSSRGKGNDFFGEQRPVSKFLRNAGFSLLARNPSIGCIEYIYIYIYGLPVRPNSILVAILDI